MNNILYFAFVGLIVIISLYAILKILIKKSLIQKKLELNYMVYLVV